MHRLAADAGITVAGDSQAPDPAARAARERAFRERERERREAEEADEARRIAIARRYWAQSEPLRGTLGERYLVETRNIARTECGWPDDVVRYHRPSRSLILALTLPDGAVQAVQRVLLSRDAQNLRRPDGKKLKPTRGLMDGAAVRLAGHAGIVDQNVEPLLLAEGPETGLALWTATGCETWIVAGSLARFTPPADRLVVVCRDDDAHGSPADRLFAATCERWRGEGLSVVVASPWAEPRGDKSDFNDVLQEQGSDAVRARIEAVLAERDRFFPAQKIDDVSPLQHASAIEPATRPNCTIDQVRAVMEAELPEHLTGHGPAHVLNNADTGSGKSKSWLEAIAPLILARRAERKRFIDNYRYSQHPPASLVAAERAADVAGLRPLRACYAADTHGLIKQHVELAKELGLIAVHDAALDRPLDPTNKGGPSACTQPDRLKHTAMAGEPTRLHACGGSDASVPQCPDRVGCRAWGRIFAVQHAEFVGMPVEMAMAHHLPEELRGFAFVLIDEPPERVLEPEFELKLELLSDRLFQQFPLYDGEAVDLEATTEAQEAYTKLRAALNNVRDGYWPKDAMEAAGCDAAFFERFVALTAMRDRPSGITAATPDEDRLSLARISFRRHARTLCGFGRMSRAIMAGEENTGRIEIEGLETRVALVRPRAKLNPHLLAEGGRLMIAGARLALEDVRRWSPAVQPMGVAAMIPDAPHQTVVHIHRGGVGKGGFKRKARQDWAKALVQLEGDPTPKATGVLVYKDREDLFTGMPGVVTGHPGALAGKNDWKTCTTLFGFGAQFLSPVDAAAAGARATGEPVPIKRPVMTQRAIAMRDGRTMAVSVPDYAHPAAATANRHVRDFDVLQGQYGRGRGVNRTAADPLLLIDVGSHVPPEARWSIS